jgi:hypothetical protein
MARATSSGKLATQRAGSGRTVEIREFYGAYRPPFDVRATVEILLAEVPPDYLAGLKWVVLRDAAGLSRRDRRRKTISRKRRVPIRTCLGFYHRAWRGRPAGIEILVDNLLQGPPSWLLRFEAARCLFVGATLYHELGHHIHATLVPEHREREDVAEAWKLRLVRRLFRRRYPGLLVFLKLLRGVAAILRSIGRLRRRLGDRSRDRTGRQRREPRPTTPRSAAARCRRRSARTRAARTCR